MADGDGKLARFADTQTSRLNARREADASPFRL